MNKREKRLEKITDLLAKRMCAINNDLLGFYVSYSNNSLNALKNNICNLLEREESWTDNFDDIDEDVYCKHYTLLTKLGHLEPFKTLISENELDNIEIDSLKSYIKFISKQKDLEEERNLNKIFIIGVVTNKYGDIINLIGNMY